jgi:phosphoribosylglycinamide formyltransferase-1
LRNIAIFASGTGSNALKIIEHFKDSDALRVALVVSNKPDASVLQMASAHQIPTAILNRRDFYDTPLLLDTLSQHGITHIVLAGFLWLVPSYLTKAFPNKIMNIHPALLPKYGGKGMYGAHVHEAVFAAKDDISGITIHYVNEHYDEGKHIFQAVCLLDEDDTPKTIAEKVLRLEHYYFPKIIEQTWGK